MKTKFSKNLLRDRLKKNLSQEKLGRLIGVHSTTISDYETGKRIPRLGKIKNISQYFGWDINEAINALLEPDPDPIQEILPIQESIPESKKDLISLFCSVICNYKSTCKDKDTGSDKEDNCIILKKIKDKKYLFKRLPESSGFIDDSDYFKTEKDLWDYMLFDMYEHIIKEFESRANRNDLKFVIYSILDLLSCRKNFINYEIVDYVKEAE